MDRYRHGAAQPNPTKSVKETTDEHRQTQMCATRPKILRDPARIFLHPPGSAGILSSPQRYKDPTRSCPSESSWLRVFVVRFLGFRLRCSVFICGFVLYSLCRRKWVSAKDIEKYGKH